MAQYLLLTDAQTHSIFQDIVCFHKDVAKASREQLEMEVEGSRALIARFNVEQNE